MLPESELTRLLKSSESHWVERKPPGANSAEIRNTLVGFANSLPEGQHAVLFIGVSNDGKPQAVPNADKLQKTVTQIATQDCYPAIRCNPTAIRVNGVELVAVVVEASNNRPHFSGHAYVRVGPETKKASPEQFEELIASRNDKAHCLLQEKNKVVTVFWQGEEAPEVSSATATICKNRVASGRPFEAECVITACDSLVVHFNVIAVWCRPLFRDKLKPSQISQTAFSVPVDKVTLSFDDENQRIKLLINF